MTKIIHQLNILSESRGRSLAGVTAFLFHLQDPGSLQQLEARVSPDWDGGLLPLLALLMACSALMVQHENTKQHLAQPSELQAFLASQTSKNEHICFHMGRSQRGYCFLAPCTVAETCILH